MDLAEGLVAALNFLSPNLGWHADSLGTGKGYSVLELVRAFEKASGRYVPYRVTSRRPGDVAECYADPKNPGELLKWSAKRTLDAMCEGTWNFQRDDKFGEN